MSPSSLWVAANTSSKPWHNLGRQHQGAQPAFLANLSLLFVWLRNWMHTQDLHRLQRVDQLWSIPSPSCTAAATCWGWVATSVHTSTDTRATAAAAKQMEHYKLFGGSDTSSVFVLEVFAVLLCFCEGAV